MPQRKLLLIILLGLILRIGYAVAIYEPSLLPYHRGDYDLYHILAEDILRGDLAFQNSGYLLRPPLFPLLGAALGLQPLLIITVNILLATCVIPVTYLLANQFDLSEKLALLSAMIVALDPTSVIYSGVLLAEPLANLLLALSFVTLIKVRQAEKRSAILSWGFLSGIFVMLSAFTRPAAYLLWLPMALWAGFVRRTVGGGQILATGAFVLPAMLGVGLWTQHNAIHFSNSSFTTIGTYNLLYYRAASVLYQATGQEIDAVYAELARRVEARLGNNTANISASKRHEHYTGSPQLQNAMTEVAIGIFRDYPLHYALTISVGLYRMLLRVSGVLVWPGLIWNVALLLAASIGLNNLRLQRDWSTGAFLCLPCLYFLLGTLLVQTSGIDTRARVMFTPLLAIMAAYGVEHMLNRRRAASASLSPHGAK